MKIIKHGSKSPKKPKEKFEEFKCDKCGCEFSAKEDEYYRHEGGGNCYSGSLTASSTYTYTWPPKDRLVCSCPECYKICMKTVTGSNYMPYSISLNNSNASTKISGTDNVVYTAVSNSDVADADKINN